MANGLKMTNVEAIHWMRSAGLSGREIARRLGVHRGTVSRYVRLGGEPIPKAASSPTGNRRAKAAAAAASATDQTVTN